LIPFKKSEKDLVSPFLTVLPESEDDSAYPRRRSRRTRKTVNYASLGDTEKPLAKTSPSKVRQKKRKINEEAQPKKQILQHKKKQKEEPQLDPYNESLPESETEIMEKILDSEDTPQIQLNGQAFKVLSRKNPPISSSAISTPTGTTTPNSPSSLFQKGTRKRQIMASFRKSMLQQHGGSPVARKSRKIDSPQTKLLSSLEISDVLSSRNSPAKNKLIYAKRTPIIARKTHNLFDNGCLVCGKDLEIENKQGDRDLCTSCTMFYKRQLTQNQRLTCINGGGCQITITSRSCHACRFVKCKFAYQNIA